MKLKKTIFLLFVSSIYCLCAKKSSADDSLHVYILAGQSNMEGQGVVDLDHPKYYNDGKGILKNVFKKTEFKSKFPHVLSNDGGFATRNDVFVRFKTRHGLKIGPLGIGFTGYEGKHHIGPEFQFGHVLGIHTPQPVLIIKTAWGGKSLFSDFRPPSSPGQTGTFYVKMITEINEGLRNIKTDFPQLGKLKPEIKGFIWFQGWNDMFNASAREEYQSNLVNLIRDVRSDLNKPRLPVIIGELGNLGPKTNKSMSDIRHAQKNAADALGDLVAFVQTHQFARPKKKSPNTTHGHHWFGNAESYFLIGNEFGKNMIKLTNQNN